MSTAPPDRDTEILDELAELGLALARKVQARGMVAADGDDQAVVDRLTVAFHRVTRSVRQSLALKNRMARARKLDERRAADDTLGGYVARNMIRKGQVRATLVRSLRKSYEYEHEYEAVLGALDETIHEASLLDPEFVDGPFDAVVERIRAELAVAAKTPPDAPWRNSG